MTSRRELADRVEKLEAEVAEMRDLITALGGTVGELRPAVKGAAKPRTPSGSKAKTD